LEREGVGGICRDLMGGGIETVDRAGRLFFGFFAAVGFAGCWAQQPTGVEEREYYAIDFVGSLVFFFVPALVLDIGMGVYSKKPTDIAMRLIAVNSSQKRWGSKKVRSYKGPHTLASRKNGRRVTARQWQPA
jgi:hypothetical protein